MGWIKRPTRSPKGLHSIALPGYHSPTISPPIPKVQRQRVAQRATPAGFLGQLCTGTVRDLGEMKFQDEFSSKFGVRGCRGALYANTLYFCSLYVFMFRIKMRISFLGSKGITFIFVYDIYICRVCKSFFGPQPTKSEGSKYFMPSPSKNWGKFSGEWGFIASPHFEGDLFVGMKSILGLELTRFFCCDWNEMI